MKRMKHIHWYSLVILSWYKGQIVKNHSVLTETVVVNLLDWLLSEIPLTWTAERRYGAAMTG